MKVVSFIYEEDIDELCANTYILIDSFNSCVVIDPSKDNDKIVNYINKNKLNLKAILITHSHVDHFRGAKVLIDTYNVPFYIGFNDEPALKDEYLNCSSLLNEHTILEVSPISVSEKDTINVLEEEIKVIDTPYHTCGGVCYYLKDSGLLFSGDSLFNNGYGRTDLPTSVRSKTIDTIKKLLKLPENTKVYPGHGLTITINEEVEFNKYLLN